MVDPEASVQEQALALVRNLVDGNLNSIEYVFVEDGLLLNAIGKQLRSSSKAEVLIQVRKLMTVNTRYNRSGLKFLASRSLPANRWLMVV